MSLNDLQKKIHSRNQGEDQSNDPVLNFQQRQIGEIRNNPAGENEIKISELEEKIYDENIAQRKKESKAKKRVFLWGGIIAGALLLISTGSLFYFLKNKAAFREKDIVFEFEYPKEAANGEQNIITIKYGNYSRVNLKNVSISFQRADAIKIVGDSGTALAKTWDLGVLEPGKDGKIEIPARIFGSEGSEYFIESAFQYVPENFNSVFKINKSGKIKVGKIPIKISISAPQDIPSGRYMEYSVICENLSEKDFSDLILQMEYPSGFSFESAKIANEIDLSDIGSDDDIFAGYLAIGEKTEFIISGTMAGDVGRGEIIKAKIGFEENGVFYAYDEEEYSTMIRESEILIMQSVEGGSENADAGSIVRFKITVKNTSEIGLTGVEIGAALEGDAINFSSVRVEKGVINSNNTAIWNSSGVSEFAYFLPSQEVELSFSLKIKDQLPITSALSKNFIIKSSPYAEATALEDEIAGNPTSVKINSKLVLTEKGFYWEEGKIKNSGPIPPKVGQTTTYTIHWQILNLANDVENVKVSAALPAGVGWSNSVAATNGNISFDSITRTVVWNIGSVSANVSIKLPIYEAVFQVSVNPAQADVGRPLSLLGQASASGIDKFTGIELTSSAPSKTTELKEDGKLGYEDYKVSY